MNTPANSDIINVCIIPPAEIGQRCIELSEGVRSQDTMFTLDGTTKFAHMTLFMARLTRERLEEVLESVEAVLRDQESFECEHTDYFLTAGRYLEASYRKSEPLLGLHSRLIDALKQYRINPGDPYEEAYFTPYTPGQRKNAEETGYDLAYDLYRPHITLTRYHEGHAPDMLPTLPEESLSFPLRKIAVFKADNNGAVYEQLKEWDL